MSPPASSFSCGFIYEGGVLYAYRNNNLLYKNDSWTYGFDTLAFGLANYNGTVTINLDQYSAFAVYNE
jgi:hypothetical protein